MFDTANAFDSSYYFYLKSARTGVNGTERRLFKYLVKKQPITIDPKAQNRHII